MVDILSNLSPRELVWKDILTESSLALGRDTLTGWALVGAINAFDHINAHIPTELLKPVYYRSMRLTDKNGAPVYWDARAPALAYPIYLEENAGKQKEDLDKSRLLANPGRDCLRCFGANPECPHDPLTPEEDEARRKEWAEEARRLRENLAKRPAVQKFPALRLVDDDKITFTCSDPACARKVGSDVGWQYNDLCDVRVPGPQRSGERLTCQGRMKVL